MGVDFNKFLIGIEIDEQGSFAKVMQMIDKINASGTKGASKAESDLRSKTKSFEKFYQGYTRQTEANEKAFRKLDERMSEFARQSTLAKTHFDSTGKAIDGTTKSTQHLGGALMTTAQAEKMFTAVNAAMTGQKNKDTKALNKTGAAIVDLGKKVDDTSKKETKAVKDKIADNAKLTKTAKDVSKTLDEVTKKQRIFTNIGTKGQRLLWTEAGMKRFKALPDIMRRATLEGAKFLDKINLLTRAAPRMLAAFNPGLYQGPGSASYAMAQRGRSGGPQMGSVEFGSRRRGVIQEIGIPIGNQRAGRGTKARGTARSSSWITDLNEMGGEAVRLNMDKALNAIMASNVIPRPIMDTIRKTSDGVRAKILDMVSGYTKSAYDSIAELDPKAKQIIVQKITGMVGKGGPGKLKEFTLGPPEQGAVNALPADWVEKLKRITSKPSQTSGPMQFLTTQTAMNVAALEQLAKVKFLAKSFAGSMNVGELIKPGTMQKGRGYMPGQKEGVTSEPRADDMMKDINRTNEALNRLRGSVEMGGPVLSNVGGITKGIMAQVNMALSLMGDMFKNVQTGAVQDPSAMARLNTLVNQMFASAVAAGVEKGFTKALQKSGLPIDLRAASAASRGILAGAGYQGYAGPGGTAARTRRYINQLSGIQPTAFRTMDPPRFALGIHGAEGRPRSFEEQVSPKVRAKMEKARHENFIMQRRVLRYTGQGDQLSTQIGARNIYEGIKDVGKFAYGRPQTTNRLIEQQAQRVRSMGRGPSAPYTGFDYNYPLALPPHAAPTKQFISSKDIDRATRGFSRARSAASAGGAIPMGGAQSVWGSMKDMFKQVGSFFRQSTQNIINRQGAPGRGAAQFYSGGGVPPIGPISGFASRTPPGLGPGMDPQPYGSPINQAARHQRGGFGDVFKRMAMWGIAGGAMYGAIRQFKELISAAKEYQDVLTELRKVMPISTDFDRLGASIFDMSKRFAAATTQTGQIMKVFAQQGLQAQQVIDLTRIALIGMNSANMTAGQSVEFLTSAMRTWNVDAVKTIGYIDKIMHVQAKFPVTAPELATASQLLSPAMKATGGTPDLLFGVIAGVKEITRQTGKEIANALKTALARYTNPSQRKLLESKGINVKTATGYRSMQAVYGEIAGKMKAGELSGAEVFDISKSLGGIRRYIQVLALLNNWDRAMQAMKISAESYGEAIRANQLHMKKFGSQVIKAGAAWREFGVEVSNKTLIPILEGIVRIGGALAGLGTDFAKSGIGGFALLMAGVGGVIKLGQVAGRGIAKGATSKVMDKISRGGSMTMFDRQTLINNPAIMADPMVKQAMIEQGAFEVDKKTGDIIGVRKDFRLKRHTLGAEYERSFGAERLAKMSKGYGALSKSEQGALVKKLTRNQQLFEAQIPTWMKTEGGKEALRAETMKFAGTQVKEAGVSRSTFLVQQAKAGFSGVEGGITKTRRGMIALGNTIKTVSAGMLAMAWPMAILAGIAAAIKLYQTWSKYVYRNHVELTKSINEEGQATKAYTELLNKMETAKGLPTFGRSAMMTRMSGAGGIGNIVQGMLAGDVTTFRQFGAGLGKLGVEGVSGDKYSQETTRRYADTVRDFLVYEARANFHKSMAKIESRTPDILNPMMKEAEKFYKSGMPGKVFTPTGSAWQSSLVKLQRSKFGAPGLSTKQMPLELEGISGMLGKTLAAMAVSMGSVAGKFVDLDVIMAQVNKELSLYNMARKVIGSDPVKILSKLPALRGGIMPIFEELIYNENYLEKGGKSLEAVKGLYKGMGGKLPGGSPEMGPGQEALRESLTGVLGVAFDWISYKMGGDEIDRLSKVFKILQDNAEASANSVGLLSSVIGKFKDYAFNITADFKATIAGISASASAMSAMGLPYDRKSAESEAYKSTYLQMVTTPSKLEAERAKSQRRLDYLNMIQKKGAGSILEGATTPKELTDAIETLRGLKKTAGGNIINLSQEITAAQKQVSKTEYEVELFKSSVSGKLIKQAADKAILLALLTSSELRDVEAAQVAAVGAADISGRRSRIDMLKGTDVTYEQKRLTQSEEKSLLVEERRIGLIKLKTDYDRNTLANGQILYDKAVQTYELETKTLLLAKDSADLTERKIDIKNRLNEYQAGMRAYKGKTRVMGSQYGLDMLTARGSGTASKRSAISIAKQALLQTQRQVDLEEEIFRLKEAGFGEDTPTYKNAMKLFAMETDRLHLQQQITDAIEAQSRYYDKINQASSQVQGALSSTLGNLGGFQQMLFGDTKQNYLIDKELEAQKKLGTPEAKTRIAELEREKENLRMNRPNLVTNLAKKLGEIFSGNVSKELSRAVIGEGGWIGKMFSGVSNQERMEAEQLTQLVIQTGYLRQIATGEKFDDLSGVTGGKGIKAWFKDKNNQRMLGAMGGMYAGVGLGGMIAKNRKSTGNLVGAGSSMGTMIGGLSAFGTGPLGPFIGGILGGALGGLFSSRDIKNPINKNTEAIINNTNALERLESRIFNAPTNFDLPSTALARGGITGAGVVVNVYESNTPKETGEAVLAVLGEQYGGQADRSGSAGSIL